MQASQWQSVGQATAIQPCILDQSITPQTNGLLNQRTTVIDEKLTEYDTSLKRMAN